MKNELLHIDCMEYMKTCEDKQFNLAIVDPPYGIDFARTHTGKGWTVRPSKSWDKEAPTPAYFEELMRVSKNQIIWGANYFQLPPSQGWVFWDKRQRTFSLADGELAWTSFDKALRVFDYSRAEALQEGKIHPTQKPVALYKWLLSHYAHAGDSLLDTHSGSGSFRIAAYDMGFDLVSCELDADYCHANEARYQAHIAQQELIPVQEIQQLTFGEK